MRRIQHPPFLDFAKSKKAGNFTSIQVLNMQSPVLVINSGSSSVKFSLVDSSSHAVLFSGMAEKLGVPGSCLHTRLENDRETMELGNANHQIAIEAILLALGKKGFLSGLKAVGHRVVHGGEFFKASTIITEAVIKAIESCIPYAPLHNPANLTGIHAAIKALPNIPQVAVFDTAFHQTLPEFAYRYAVPGDWYSKYGARRYGFHGTSHRYVSMEAARFLGMPLDKSAFITAHLGNGASTTAVLNGHSVDTSMGFTPLEGLVMGTRSGDIDPGLPGYIAGAMDISIEAVIDILNKKSGLLGLSGFSGDVRELQEAAINGHEGAILALEVFVFRLAKSIAALSISLPKIDALVFTGGIGENSAFVRRKTLERLAIMGFFVDDALNEQAIRGRQGLITREESKKALVINTNEELMIAIETETCINQ